jgi:hypothetical protein
VLLKERCGKSADFVGVSRLFSRVVFEDKRVDLWKKCLLLCTSTKVDLTLAGLSAPTALAAELHSARTGESPVPTRAVPTQAVHTRAVSTRAVPIKSTNDVY